MSEEFKRKWLASMIAKHGSEQAVREFMQSSSNKSKRNAAGTGGFAKLTPEERRVISKKALDKRWGKREEPTG